MTRPTPERSAGSCAGGIINVISDSAAERVITIDGCSECWSTRLYLLALLLERSTSVRRVLIVQMMN
jgi:hypothetical protein